MLKPADPEPKRPEPGDERPVGEIVHQLVEDGKAYAKAELAVAKAMAADKGKALAIPAAMLGGAFLFLQAAVTILGVAVFLGLLPLMGPVLAGLVAFLIFAGIAGGLGWFAVQKAKRDL